MIKRFLGKLDPKMVIAALVAALLLGAYWAVIALSEEYYIVAAPAGSTFSSDSGGLKVLHNYLERMEVEVETLQSFEELPEEGTIVVAATEPMVVAPTKDDGRRLIDWVEGGGRLVMVGANGRDVLAGVPVGASRSTKSDEATLTPLLPSFYSDGVEKVSAGESRFLTQDGTWVTHMKDSGGQVLTSRAYGEGEIVWLSSVTPMSNERIAEEDNARLSTLIVAAATPVYFDEYHHGFVRGASMWERLRPGGQAAVTLGLVALLVFLLALSRRLGSAIEPAPARPMRSGAYIGSLAELYRKAGARAETLRSLEEGLRESLTRRYGSLDAGKARYPEVRTLLDRSEAARQSSISQDEFVSIARDIARVRREVEGRDD